MYSPVHFRESDPVVLRDYVRGLGAGELVTFGSAGLDSTFLPLLVSDDGMVLTGHLARANPQWKRADLSVPALVTWRGPDAYVSPRYYPSKQVDPAVVPTWDYVSVQARGRLVVHDDPEWTRALVTALTDAHEDGAAQPWAVSDAPDAFVGGRVRAVVGVEVRVTSLEGSWKLSQNRSDVDVDGVVAGLAAHGPGSPEARVAGLVDARRRTG